MYMVSMERNALNVLVKLSKQKYQEGVRTYVDFVRIFKFQSITKEFIIIIVLLK